MMGEEFVTIPLVELVDVGVQTMAVSTMTGPVVAAIVCSVVVIVIVTAFIVWWFW